MVEYVDARVYKTQESGANMNHITEDMLRTLYINTAIQGLEHDYYDSNNVGWVGLPSHKWIIAAMTMAESYFGLSSTERYQWLIIANDMSKS